MTTKKEKETSQLAKIYLFQYCLSTIVRNIQLIWQITRSYDTERVIIRKLKIFNVFCLVVTTTNTNILTCDGRRQVINEGNKVQSVSSVANFILDDVGVVTYSKLIITFRRVWAPLSLILHQFMDVRTQSQGHLCPCSYILHPHMLYDVRNIHLMLKNKQLTPLPFSLPLDSSSMSLPSLSSTPSSLLPHCLMLPLPYPLLLISHI